MLEKFKKEKKLAIIALILLGLLILSIIIGLGLSRNKGTPAALPTTATTTAAVTTAAPTTAATTAPATTAATTVAVPAPVELALDNGVMTAYRNGAIAEDVNGIVYNKLDDTWYYLTKGRVDTDYVGMAQNAAGNWYIHDGKVDFSYNGPLTVGGQTYNIQYGKAV